MKRQKPRDRDMERRRDHEARDKGKVRWRDKGMRRQRAGETVR
jgi:hypothetical protein